MERYLDAARKISRLAIGDPAMPVMVNIHRLDPEHPQDERVDDLPFGTRGGIAVRSEFPVDGTYIVRRGRGRRAGPRPGDPRRRRACRASLPRWWPRRSCGGCSSRSTRSVGSRSHAPVDRSTGSAGQRRGTGGCSRCRRRTRRRSGSRCCGRPAGVSAHAEGRPELIGVAFVQRTEARDETTLRPRMRSRGTQPAITA